MTSKTYGTKIVLTIPGTTITEPIVVQVGKAAFIEVVSGEEESFQVVTLDREGFTECLRIVEKRFTAAIHI